MVKIVDAIWTPQVNLMVIVCDYGEEFRHLANRWRVKCPGCGRTENLRETRRRIELR